MLSKSCTFGVEISNDIKMTVREKIKNANRIVVKVGTSTLTYQNGRLNIRRIERLSRVLCDLKNRGKEIIVVSSGAVGVGVSKLDLKERPKDTGTKQATAAVGQCELVNLYGKLFSEYGYTVGQVLLTKDVVDNGVRESNVRKTFYRLLELGVIPIVNENDTVSIDELEFGDNDTLSAIVSTITRADVLIILSDIDGLYDSNPRNNNGAKLIHTVTEITDEIRNMAGGAGGMFGTGGMMTKISAAEIATKEGIHVIITNGEQPEILYEILDGEEKGTVFIGKE